MVTASKYYMAAIEDNDLKAYTCEVKRLGDHLSCLDIAAASTLNGYISTSRPIDDGNASATHIAHVRSGPPAPPSTPEVSTLFGQDRLCDNKRVGDQRINSFDIAVLLFTYFGVLIYEFVPSFDVATVQGATQTYSLCDMDLTYSELVNQQQFSGSCHLVEKNSFPGSYGRRLQQTNELNAGVVQISDGQYGAWYRITIPHVVIALELILSTSSPVHVALSNKAPPDENDDVNYGTHQVRFVRDGTQDNCASIISMIDSNIVMYRNVLAIGQVPLRGQTLCQFDVLLWVPHNQRRLTSSGRHCSVSVHAGSGAIDGISGLTQSANSDCTFQSPPPSPPPPMEPPPPPALPPPSPVAVAPPPPPSVPIWPIVTSVIVVTLAVIGIGIGIRFRAHRALISAI